ncbi:GntR family transcriptional regulator [Streptomyces sp. NBC_01353]|uniref:GntR family transcriptional regulator n=1 Tax=Streptomyces sp. NBC_01353 TaxID=2903835 RepID=UPI002E317596|nr:GntR family transcriptional regulator [Streptomyces sp. NBC_01353]
MTGTQAADDTAPAGAEAGAGGGAGEGDAAPAVGGGWLRDQVCEGLRDRIITGRLKPGDRLVERDVAEEFGVSRVPVREAIRILMSEGFLQALSPRRIVVKELSRQDVENLFDMREALEVLAVRRAAERRTQGQLDDLHALLEEARRATLSGRPDRISRANTAFHHFIVELSRNDLLAATLESLEGRLRWLFQQIDDPGSLWDEHRVLYEAIAAADADAAAECSLHHVRHYRDVAIRLLFEQGESA